jgi:predicted dithiol-disulfide oxidoreductase (DUF899 family)
VVRADNAFAVEDGTVYHTYSTYSRRLDILCGMYQWLDRAPLDPSGKQVGSRGRRHDAFDN